MQRTVVASFTAVFGVAFGLALVLTPLAGWLGRRWGVVDRPGGRRRHQGVVPRLGGVALYLAFAVAALLAQVLPVPRTDPQELTRFTGLLLGTSFIFVFGLWDDLRDLPPGPQFAAQVVATLIGMAGLVFVEVVNNPFSSQPDARVWFPWPLTLAFTLFWMIGMMTTVNWLDGLDGLAAGVTAIASVVLFIHAAFRLQPPQLSVSLLPLALAGATLGFLPYNFYPARVFMGSAGAYTLGFALGGLAIIGGAKVASILLVMGLPILDVAWQIFRRWREGRRPDQADRGHLHHRLFDLGLSQRWVVLGYYLFSAFFGGLALLISSRLYKLLALVLFGLVALGMLAWLSRFPTRSERNEPPAG